MDDIHGSDPVVRRRRFDVAEYHLMSDAGILHEDDRIELIDGELLHMPVVGAPHIGTVMALTRLLLVAAGDRAEISVQSPVRLDQHNEPEPDLALLHPRSDNYRGEPPLAADVLLLVEVSDNTLRYDRWVKVPLYARYGIPEVWVVELATRCVEVFRVPVDRDYAPLPRCGDDEAVGVPGLAGARLAVRDIVGPPVT